MPEEPISDGGAMQTRADSSAQSSQRYWLEANFNIRETTCYLLLSTDIGLC